MDNQLTVDHECSEEGGIFYLIEDDQKIGHLTYQRPSRSRLILTYVEVDTAHRGRGLARRLIDEIVFFSRDQKSQITPTCGAARAIMRRTPEYSDVLQHGSVT